MIPWLAKIDMFMFYRYLDNSKVYFEWGSGGSTYQASLRENIKKIYSVESDIEWQTKLKSVIKDHSKLEFIFAEMHSEPKSLGYPGKNSNHLQWRNYSNKILELSKEEQEQIDFIMIDGRFRVACCLKCFDVISENCIIAFDDFLNRSKYHVVLDYFDIIETTSDKRMVMLKKKKGINTVEKSVISKYEVLSL